MSQENPSSASQGSGLDPNLASMLTYLCGLFTAIIFLLLERDNKTVRLHAWHSLIFCGFTIVLSIVLTVLGQVMMSISFLLSGAFSIVNLLVWLGILALWIVLMVKAYQGSILNLPVITDIARKQAEK